jgi:hypothetical protein
MAPPAIQGLVRRSSTPNPATNLASGTIEEFWADLTYTGKTLDDGAAGMHQSLKKWGYPNKQMVLPAIQELVCQSHMPESYAKSYNQLGIWHN